MVNETKIRKLKVYPGHHGNAFKPHPFIRLSGKYLSRFDFKIGDEVTVTLEPGRIVISNEKTDKTSNNV